MSYSISKNVLDIYLFMSKQLNLMQALMTISLYSFLHGYKWWPCWIFFAKTHWDIFTNYYLISWCHMFWLYHTFTMNFALVSFVLCLLSVSWQLLLHNVTRRHWLCISNLTNCILSKKSSCYYAWTVSWCGLIPYLPGNDSYRQKCFDFISKDDGFLDSGMLSSIMVVHILVSQENNDCDYCIWHLSEQKKNQLLTHGLHISKLFRCS